MIKKYMNQLYKEIEQIRRKIDSGKLKYFCQKDYTDGDKYTIFLRDGSYFNIDLGSNNIPKLRKRDIVYIQKKIRRKFSGKEREFCERDYFDSDTGFFRIGDTLEIYDITNEKRTRYNIDYSKQIDTGEWD